MGWYDTQVNNPLSPTPTLATLAGEGLVLDRHYAYQYCSPTRRSFLTGRLPTSLSTSQPDLCSNYTPLDAPLISEVLARSHVSHFIGKGHLGYETTDHLPVNRGFATHVGYLGAAETYSHGGGDADPNVGEHDMWEGEGPGFDAVREMQYSTDFYAQRASQIIHEHGEKSLFLYVGFQNTHAPYTLPPKWQGRYFPEYGDQVYPNMLAVLDEGVLNVTSALKGAGMWENTLLLFFSDNGATGVHGNNCPLRGHKHDPYDGGTRVFSFLCGGFLPVRGLALSVVHVADWLPTFAGLAGVAVPGGVEGVDVWPMLTRRNLTQPRPVTVTTEVSALFVDHAHLWKLITLAGQSGFYSANGWQTAGPTTDCLASCQPDPPQLGYTDWLVNGPAFAERASFCPVCNSSLPCLFELHIDPSERHNRATERPDIVRFLEKAIDDANKRGAHVTGHLDYETLARDYTPIVDTGKEWRGFKGPCYKRKESMPVL